MKNNKEGEILHFSDPLEKAQNLREELRQIQARLNEVIRARVELEEMLKTFVEKNDEQKRILMQAEEKKETADELKILREHLRSEIGKLYSLDKYFNEIIKMDKSNIRH